MESTSEYANLPGPSETGSVETTESSRSSSYNVENMFEKICRQNDAFFRLQQRNEQDLTFPEKLDILRNLYDEKPAIFLTRYERYLNAEDAVFFETFAKSDPDVKYFYDKLQLLVSKRRKFLSKNGACSNLANKNRRFVQMQRMLADKTCEYFTDREMRRRQPLLYDQMIGDFQTPEEMTSSFHRQNSSNFHKNAPLSSILLDMYDNKQISERKFEESNVEAMSEVNLHNDQNGCHGNDSEEEEDDEEGIGEKDESKEKPTPTMSDNDKNCMRNLFVHEMYENFVDGRDAEYFDYDSLCSGVIDTDTEKEILRLQEIDEQDQYFDREDDVIDSQEL